MTKFVIRFKCVVELGGDPILDEFSARILRSIEERRSIVASSRILGIPYANIWKTISRIEKLAGGPVLIARRGGRGGGGAKLTALGKKLLQLYEEGIRLLESAGLSASLHPITNKPHLSIAYSSDPLLDKIVERLSQNGCLVRGFCIGSGLSLAMLSLEEVDTACIHLYDPSTRSYNEPYLERFWLGDRVMRLGGYERQLVMACGDRVKEEVLGDILEGLLVGRLRLANRNRGSGTRIYLDHILREAGRKIGAEPRQVRGYEREHYTHEEVARSISSGNADVGLVLRHVAEEYDLRWIHATWERYEYYALKSRARNEGIRRLEEILKSSWLKEILSSTLGYREIS